MCMTSVKFNYADVRSVSLDNKALVKKFVSEIFRLENKGLEQVTYVFCSDNYLLDINKSYLNHDYFTDIITFDLSEENGTIGEIYISVDRVKDNSKSHNTSFENEILRVIFHGALHLC